MKKVVIISIVISVICIVFAFVSFVFVEGQEGIYSNYETERVELGTITTVVEADGFVQSDQSAMLFWKIPGEVGEVSVKTGDRVAEGDVLAALRVDSLPAHIVAAQAELISAEREMEDLLISDRHQAEALKAVNDAQLALEDALHPEIIQAEARVNLAEAQEALKLAEHNYTVVKASTSQEEINAAYSNLLLAEDNIAKTEAAIVDANNKDLRAVANSGILEEGDIANIRSDIREIIKQLEFILIQNRLAYQRSLETYNELLLPPDPVEIAKAESELAFATANLDEVQREWERVKDGYSSAEIAVLEAELNDAIREYEGVKDGPNPDDISELEARITAAEAAIAQQTVIAPFDGTITQVHTQEHDIVSPGTIAFQIDDLSRRSAILSISEVDVNRVFIGDNVSLSFEAIPGEVFSGKVVKIPSVGTRILGTTNFRITVEILNPDIRIKPGMTASVEIIVDQLDGVIKIPGNAVRSLDGELVVYKMIEEGRYKLPSLGQNDDGESDDQAFLSMRETIRYDIQPVTVTLGTTSSAYIEVLAGDVQPGDLIILNPLDQE